LYSRIHTKHINTLCGQNVELLNVKQKVSTALLALVYASLRQPFLPISVPNNHLRQFLKSVPSSDQTIQTTPQDKFLLKITKQHKRALNTTTPLALMWN